MWQFGPPNIYKLKENKNIPALIKALHHNDKQTRQNATVALGEIRDTNTQESLIEMLEDQEPDVRLSAKEALDKFNWSPKDPREKALYAFASGDTSIPVLVDLMPKVYINYGRYDWLGSRGFTLPDKTIVFEKDNADYTINMTWTKAVVGQYTGGQKAMQESCIVVISNCKTGKTIASKLFASPPPQRIYGNATGGLGSPSFSEINDYVVEWYNNIDDPFPSENWRGGLLRLCFGLMGLTLIVAPLPLLQYRDSRSSVIASMVLGGIIIALSIFLGQNNKKTHKILNYRKEVKRPVDPIEDKRRAQKLGIEVARCPNCGTLNSLAVVNCERCKTNLENIKPISNPHL